MSAVIPSNSNPALADQPAVAALVEALVRARQSGVLADDASAGLQLPDAAQAYAVQAAVAKALDLHAGKAPAYWKSGGPNRQTVLTHAALPAAGVWMSPAVAGAWSFAMRGIEAEVALRLGRAVDADLAASLDVASAAQLVDAMTVSIEVVDSRWQRLTGAPALLRLADLQSHGALVLGEWVPYAARDWQAQICRLSISGQNEQMFTGTHTLADPAWLLRDWLLHATRGGALVPAGTVVTTGSWNGMTPALAGDKVRVRFDGIGEASLQL